jgi:uncharacterized protein (DUF1800 family)
LRRLRSINSTPQQLARLYAMNEVVQLQANLRRQQQRQAATVATQGPTSAARPRVERQRQRTMGPEQLRLLKKRSVKEFLPGATIAAMGELAVAKLLRTTESKRQLHEVMVDFWSNHFNVDVKKGAVRALKIVDERAVIRPHVWGKFRDLLGASAKSPAMLHYLDNVRSTRLNDTPVGQQRPGMPNRPRRKPVAGREVNSAAMAGTPADEAENAMMPQDMPQRPRGGINENYARELMELHTLGVEGGYTQKDVQEVARCLTGWSVRRTTGEFMFRSAAHDDGEKLVLGQRIPGRRRCS